MKLEELQKLLEFKCTCDDWPHYDTCQYWELYRAKQNYFEALLDIAKAAQKTIDLFDVEECRKKNVYLPTVRLADRLKKLEGME